MKQNRKIFESMKTSGILKTIAALAVFLMTIPSFALVMLLSYHALGQKKSRSRLVRNKREACNKVRRSWGRQKKTVRNDQKIEKKD